MRIKEITDKFLDWEKENELYEIKVQDYPIYPFIRTEIYESLIFTTSLTEILKKTSTILKAKVNLFKIAINSLEYFRKKHILNRANLFITNTDSKLKFEGKYVDYFCDKLIKEISENISILEFPNLQDYHFKEITNKEITVKADIFYVLERLYTKKIDNNSLKSEVSRIFELYSDIYTKLHGFPPEREGVNLLFNRFKRNLQRIHLYERFIKRYRPNKIYLKSAYSPMNQIFIQVCKKYNVRVIELQHGHIYPFHIGYVLPKERSTLKYFPDEILVWSNYYKEVLIKNNWAEHKINVTGDFTYNHDINKNYGFDDKLLKTRKQYRKIITLICQHTLDKEFIQFLENIQELPSDVLIFAKLHPRYKEQQEQNFMPVVKQNKNFVLIKEGSLKDYLSISDLIIGVYSTGVIEAVEMGKKVHIINTRMSEFFQDLQEKEIVQRSDNIISSYKLINESGRGNKTVEFREKFKGNI
ncbi:hypothetical protein [Aquimarina mytili]|uniref:Capsule biosynthesis protein n=1 Tax=Aquimarina mytili TaxID=874423 RepID=A0A936ZYH9_9FLAO|nr:hypothetical protein [Aquimarina mytili]MBL0684666.1 hypothetical protein [Aquimarina mytili]